MHTCSVFNVFRPRIILTRTITTRTGRPGTEATYSTRQKKLNKSTATVRYYRSRVTVPATVLNGTLKVLNSTSKVLQRYQGRYRTVLQRYSTVLRRYSTVLRRYSTVLRRHIVSLATQLAVLRYFKSKLTCTSAVLRRSKRGRQYKVTW